MARGNSRDKRTAEAHGILPSTAANIKRMLSKGRNELDVALMREGGPEQLLEQLQKYLFGTVESFPYTQTTEELRALKRWVEAVASQYFMLSAISLYEACYLVEFNHTNRVGVVKSLVARAKRFEIILAVTNECIFNGTSLRRFTADEQNDFLHG